MDRTIQLDGSYDPDYWYDKISPHKAIRIQQLTGTGDGSYPYTTCHIEQGLQRIHLSHGKV
ncbi:MAG: hypothetical protein JEZ14_16370 [Marinilabiliaceae bacterium]|nr:hypothetical protein [Marinilabiliaceae bacterium]